MIEITYTLPEIIEGLKQMGAAIILAVMCYFIFTAISGPNDSSLT